MVRTFAVLIGLAIVCAFASPASAVNLCFVVTDGAGEGSQIFLKGVDLGPRKASPVHGYYAQFSSTFGFIAQFRPLYGQSLVQANRGLVLGLTMPEAFLNGGNVSTLQDYASLNIGCLPGPDGRIEVGDTCDGFVFGLRTEVTVIPCNDVKPLP